MIWKIKSPPKTRLFMWNVLENKAPTWDILQNRNFHGPGWCPLCKENSETIYHLFMECWYIKEVMKECSLICGVAFRWEGTSILEGWHSWCTNPSLWNCRAIPLLIIWGVWLARNQIIFSDKVCPPGITMTKSCGLLSFPP